jgi:hypothetical protein
MPACLAGRQGSCDRCKLPSFGNPLSWLPLPRAFNTFQSCAAPSVRSAAQHSPTSCVENPRVVLVCEWRRNVAEVPLDIAWLCHLEAAEGHCHALPLIAPCLSGLRGRVQGSWAPRSAHLPCSRREPAVERHAPAAHAGCARRPNHRHVLWPDARHTAAACSAGGNAEPDVHAGRLFAGSKENIEYTGYQAAAVPVTPLRGVADVRAAAYMAARQTGLTLFRV